MPFAPFAPRAHHEEATLLHPAGTLRWLNDGMGYGVIASTFIPKGTITWVLDPLDQILDGVGKGVLACGDLKRCLWYGSSYRAATRAARNLPPRSRTRSYQGLLPSTPSRLPDLQIPIARVAKTLSSRSGTLGRWKDGRLAPPAMRAAPNAGSRIDSE